MNNNVASSTPARVLSRATQRAARTLRLDDATLEHLLGAPLTADLDPQSEMGRQALHLIELYQSLVALTGNDTVALVHWLHTQNTYLHAVPAQALLTPGGLTRVNAYLNVLRHTL